MKQLLFCLLLSNCLFAQDQRLSFGISVSPFLSYTILNTSTEDLEDNVQRLRTALTSRPSFSADVSVRYHLRRNLLLLAGAGYLNGGYQYKVEDFDPQVLYPIFPRYRQLSVIRHSVRIPLYFQQYLNTSKERLFLTGGISSIFNVRTYSKTIHTYNDGRSYVTRESYQGIIRSVNFAAGIGFGYQFPLTKRVDFFMQPTFQIDRRPLFEKVVFQYYPYSFGFNFGCYLR